MGSLLPSTEQQWSARDRMDYCATHAGLARIVTDCQAQNGSNMTTEKLLSIFLFSVFLFSFKKKRKNHFCEIGLLCFAGYTAVMRAILKFD